MTTDKDAKIRQLVQDSGIESTLTQIVAGLGGRRATPLPLVDCKVEELIAFIATHSWRESRFAYPRPSSHVPMHPLLQKIEQLWGLTPEQIDRIMGEAQEKKETTAP